MAMIGEQFMVGNEICGMVLSLRYPWDQVKFLRIPMARYRTRREART